MEIAHVTLTVESVLPVSEFVSILDGHVVGYVIGLVGLGCDVVLMVLGVEQVGKVPLFVFSQSEGLRKVGRGRSEVVVPARTSPLIGVKIFGSIHPCVTYETLRRRVGGRGDWSLVRCRLVWPRCRRRRGRVV